MKSEQDNQQSAYDWDQLQRRQPGVDSDDQGPGPFEPNGNQFRDGYSIGDSGLSQS